MNTPAAGPPTESPISEETATSIGAGTLGAVGLITGLLFTAYMIAFHAGAAYLSYQKFGSVLWAILDFFFPYFYYPYYAFAYAGPSQNAQTLLGGARRRMVRSRGFRRL